VSAVQRSRHPPSLPVASLCCSSACELTAEFRQRGPLVGGLDEGVSSSTLAMAPAHLPTSRACVRSCSGTGTGVHMAARNCQFVLLAVVAVVAMVLLLLPLLSCYLLLLLIATAAAAAVAKQMLLLLWLPLHLTRCCVGGAGQRHHPVRRLLQPRLPRALPGPPRGCRDPLRGAAVALLRLRLQGAARVPASLPTCLPASLPTCLPASLPASLPACPHACISACLSACLHLCLPLRMPASLPASLLVRLSASVPASLARWLCHRVITCPAVLHCAVADRPVGLLTG
jgi:hypothetical protein